MFIKTLINNIYLIIRVLQFTIYIFTLSLSKGCILHLQNFAIHLIQKILDLGRAQSLILAPVGFVL